MLPCSRLPLLLQGVVLTVSAAAAVVVPPAQGLAMLVPLDAAAAARVAPLALAGGARLVARGPLPGSLIVEGRRAGLWRPLLGAGIVMAASPAAGCGSLGA